MRIPKSMMAVLVILSLAVWLPAQARGMAEATIGGKSIKVEYGRPNLQGRGNPQGDLAVGNVWRLGMNQATELHSQADLKFGDVEVAAGDYSLFAKKVAAEEWHLLVNEQTGQWGTQHDPSKDIAEIPMTLKSVSPQVEKFTIEIEGTGDSSGTFSFSWGSSALTVDFTVQ
ncbi:MAG TPA: DUF2911 domain-containing protein [Acidobacteriota bacterium]|nr:DUF2911 domain-containing protein [Acidobacteriota bacterium]